MLVKGKRRFLSRLVSAVGLNRSPHQLGPRRRLLVLTYHRVLDADLNVFPLYPDVVDVSPEDFDRQMALVSEYFDPLVASDIASMIDGDRPWPRRPIAITFDDGYKDNVAIALPILRKHGIRATFFVTAGDVENRRLFWWDHIWYSVMHCPSPCLRVSYPKPAVLRTDSLEARRASAECLITMVKTAVDVDLSRLKESVVEASGVEVPQRELSDKNVASWDEVGLLVRSDMEVGSHSLSHRILSSLSPAIQRHELGGSKSLLEKRLGVTIASLAYPGGGATASVRRAVSAAGFRVAVGSAGPADRVDRICRYHVHRQSIGTNEPHHLFRSMLMIPEVFTL